jgi:hypothetical protein
MLRNLLRSKLLSGAGMVVLQPDQFIRCGSCLELNKSTISMLASMTQCQEQIYGTE